VDNVATYCGVIMYKPSLSNLQKVRVPQKITSSDPIHETGQLQGDDDDYSLKLNQADEGAQAALAVFSERTAFTSSTSSEGSEGSMGITGPNNADAAILNAFALTEILSTVSGYLPSPHDTVALSGVNREGRMSLNVEREAALAEVTARKVRTGKEFRETLECILNLPECYQSPLLAVLGGSIPRLDKESGAAFDAWVPHAQERLANSDLLAELWATSVGGTFSATPHMAVWRGANIQAVGQRYHLDPNAVADLEYQAAACTFKPLQAGAAAAMGRNIQAVATQFGILSDGARYVLETNSINSQHENSAGRAVCQGANVQTVAQESGITTPKGIALLERRAIGETGNAATAVSRALDEGESISAVAKKFGITTPENINLLAMHTVRSLSPKSAGGAAESGGNVTEIAKLYGITDEMFVTELELRAVLGSPDDGSPGSDDDGPLPPARQAVERGENVQTVALQYGINGPYAMNRLQYFAAYSEESGAARAAVRKGEPWDKVADRLNITNVGARLALELIQVR
jgi:transposase-like protein